MHTEAKRFVSSMLGQLPPRQSVIEIGSRDINGSVRDLFGGLPYLGLDIQGGRGVDLVIDATDYTPDAPVDTVVCCEVLEHVAHPARLIEAAARFLAPDGVLLLTAATDPRRPHSAVDGAGLRDGEHYQNISRAQLRRWLEASFDTFDITVDPRGDIYAVATVRPADPGAGEAETTA